MHRSSESIASLAAALAKAQMLLTNPEKSLTAIGSHRSVRPSRGGPSAMRHFRAASTSCARPWGSTRLRPCRRPPSTRRPKRCQLTTVLAHSSGEWIASDWPVCALSEMATPRRMGAALTYARRYALFTLVGIAGEEDLDAPISADSRPRLPELTETDQRRESSTEAVRARCSAPSPQTGSPGHRQSRFLTPRSQSPCATSCSANWGAAWAQRALVAKNTLTTVDANLVEAAFASRLAGFADGGFNEEPPPPDRSVGYPGIAGETVDTPGRVALLGALRASVGLSSANRRPKTVGADAPQWSACPSQHRCAAERANGSGAGGWEG